VLDYTHCSRLNSTDFISAGVSDGGVIQWAFDPISSTCSLQFFVTEEIPGPLFLYYKLDNYHQNYRKYVSSYSYDQLQGEPLGYDDLKRQCGPLTGPDNYDKNSTFRPVYYPCGLIADSLFLGRWEVLGLIA
jgi:LEM3 (ligand-effect modulator 3) family / CDC50 family